MGLCTLIKEHAKFQRKSPRQGIKQVIADLAATIRLVWTDEHLAHNNFKADDTDHLVLSCENVMKPLRYGQVLCTSL